MRSMQKEAAVTDTHKSRTFFLLLWKHKKCIRHIFPMENLPLTTLYFLNIHLAVFLMKMESPSQELFSIKHLYCYNFHDVADILCMLKSRYSQVCSSYWLKCWKCTKWNQVLCESQTYFTFCSESQVQPQSEQ